VKDFAIRFSIGLAAATGFVLLGLGWVFIFTGFTGLIYLYNNLDTWRIGAFVVTCALGYAIASLIYPRIRR
jgi:hypothetical protein